MKKITPRVFFFIFIYMSIAFLMLGLITRTVVAFMSIGETYLSLAGVIKVSKMSLIAGGFISAGCLIFNKIERHKEKKRNKINK